MTITEQSRHEMITALEGAIGKEAAMTLAEHLPPVGWSDVARQRDLDVLEQRTNARFDAVDARFDALHATLRAEISDQSDRLTRRFGVALATAVTALGAWTAVIG